MEVHFRLPEVDRMSTGLSGLVDKFDEACARIREGHGEIEIPGRSSSVASELGHGEGMTRMSPALEVPEEEHFRFWSPKD